MKKETKENLVFVLGLLLLYGLFLVWCSALC